MLHHCWVWVWTQIDLGLVLKDWWIIMLLTKFMFGLISLILQWVVVVGRWVGDGFEEKWRLILLFGFSFYCWCW